MKRAELVALAFTATLVSAHGLDSGQGSVVVRSDRVEVTLEVDGGAEQAALAHLALHDEEGRRLTGRIASITAGNAGHLLLRSEYTLPRPPHWLSFRLVEEDRSSASRPRRLVLSVQDEEHPAPRFVTLTSGGNVETLRFGEADPVPECGAAVLDRHPERLRGVMAMWRPDERGGGLDVVVPLGLVESWHPIARVDFDALGVAEQQEARGIVAALVAARVRLAAEDGALVSPAKSEVAFLGLDDPALAPAPEPRRLDAWTARVRVSLRFDRPGRLHWDLWNARVTTARVVVLDGGSCAERRLSTYDPSL